MIQKIDRKYGTMKDFDAMVLLDKINEVIETFNSKPSDNSSSKKDCYNCENGDICGDAGTIDADECSRYRDCSPS